MSPLETIREKIKHLYHTDPHVHLDVSIPSPKLHLKNTAATITAMYPHIFQIEECTSGTPKRHSLQYTDVLTRNIVILELDNNG